MLSGQKINAVYYEFVFNGVELHWLDLQPIANIRLMILPFNRILTGNIVFPSEQQNLIFDIQVQKQSSAEYTTYNKKSYLILI